MLINNIVVLVGMLYFLDIGAASDSLNFIIVGDWGWEGSENASAVAYQVMNRLLSPRYLLFLTLHFFWYIRWE